MAGDVPTIPLTLAHREEPFRLRFTEIAYWELEAVAGRPLGELLLSENISKYLPLVWGALRHAPPVKPWTLAAAAELLDAHYAAGGKRETLFEPILDAVYLSGVFERPTAETADDPPSADPPAPTVPANPSASAPTSPSPAG